MFEKFYRPHNMSLIIMMFDRGESYLKGSEDAYKSSLKCYEEQKVQNDALSAALNHFKDDFSTMSTSYHHTKVSLYFNCFKL